MRLQALGRGAKRVASGHKTQRMTAVYDRLPRKAPPTRWVLCKVLYMACFLRRSLTWSDPLKALLH